MTTRKENKTINKKRCRNYLYLLMMIGAWIITQTTNAQTGSVNIKQAIEIALGNNYGLWADSLNMTVTKFQNKQLSGSYLPQASFNSKINYNMAIPS